MSRTPFRFTAYGAIFRKCRPTGSPSLPAPQPSGLGDAAERVWTEFFFGDGHGVTGQGDQSTTATGTVSWFAGAITTGQGGQSVEASGSRSPYVPPPATRSGLARSPFLSAWGTVFRRGSPTGSPTTPWMQPSGLGEAQQAWDYFFFSGAAPIATAQGGQSSDGAGTAVTGAIGAIITAQSVTIDGEGTRSAISTGSAPDGLGNIAVAGALGILTVYSEDRLFSWTADHGAPIHAVAFDALGNVIIGGEAGTHGYTVRKYLRSGRLIWSYDHGATVYAVAVDSQNRILIGGETGTGGFQVRRLSPLGTVIWEVVHGAVVYGIAIGTSDGVFLGGAVGTDGYTTRYYFSFSDTPYWSYASGGAVYAVARNASYFTAGAGGVIRRHSFNGTLQNTFSFGATARAICRGDADAGSPYILEAGESTGVYTTRRHLDSNESSSVWTADHGATVYAATVNADGEFYTAGAVTSGVALRKYSAAGVLDTDWDVDPGGTLYAVAWSPLSLTAIARVTPPALPVPVAFGAASWGYAHQPPGLAIRLAISPLIQTTLPPAPPDWSGPPPQTIYRCYLTGGTSLIELPLASFQCRRRLGDSTWLTLAVPADLAEWATVLTLTPQKQVVIYAGVRAAFGQETMGEFLRAWLTEIDRDQRTHSVWMHLTGRIVPTSFTTQTRTLQSITHLGKTDAGLWTVKCAVDPLLRPDDTAEFGEISLTVGAVSYRISPAIAEMTVEELA